MSSGSTYAGSGVDYDQLDPVKLLGQMLGKETSRDRKWIGTEPMEEFRGSSAAIIKIPGGYIGHVEEGLGTKCIMADEVYRHTGDAAGYGAISQCTIAMIVNDLITVGIPPISIQMHLAVGDSGAGYLDDEKRIKAIMYGWKNGCEQSEATWTGGETPALKGVVHDDTAVFSGSAVGYLPDKYAPLRDTIEDGDHIIGLASSGVHANGISLIRKIGSSVPIDEMLELYRECLAPTTIYVKLMNGLIRDGIIPSYAINVTGHGWRKLMRSRRPFEYRIDSDINVHPVFRKFQKLGNVDELEMWKNYNMGIGFVLIVKADQSERVIRLAQGLGYTSQHIGMVAASDTRRVIMKRQGFVFEAEELSI